MCAKEGRKFFGALKIYFNKRNHKREPQILRVMQESTCPSNIATDSLQGYAPTERDSIIQQLLLALKESARPAF